MQKLWFTFSEFTRSDTATKYNINNIPSDSYTITNIFRIITFVLQPLRTILGKPIYIHSGYRCKELNEKIGGAKNSQHITGEAVDFTIKGMTVDETINFIKGMNYEYDQLINEYGKWVHLSLKDTGNRKQYFKLEVKK